MFCQLWTLTPSSCFKTIKVYLSHISTLNVFNAGARFRIYIYGKPVINLEYFQARRLGEFLQLSLVCKKWERMSTTSVLWSDLLFDDWQIDFLQEKYFMDVHNSFLLIQISFDSQYEFIESMNANSCVIIF